MDSGVDHQAYGAKQFRGKSSVVGNRILIEADFLTQLFGIQSPALGVGVESKSVQPEFRQTLKLLLNGKLHVVTRDALVIGNGFVVDERALRVIGCGHNNASRALAVGGTSHVVSGGRSVERWNRLDRDRRLRKQGEKFRQLRSHLRDVVSKVIENLLGGGRNVFRIGLQ